MKLKKIVFLMVLLAVVSKTYADDYLSVANITMNAGETKEVEICLNNATTFTAFELDIVLPAGITIPYDDDNEEYMVYGSSRFNTHTISSSLVGSTMKLLVASLQNKKIKGRSGALVSVTLKAESNISGEKTVEISNILFTDESRVGHNLDDVSFTVTVQGLPTVTADNKSREYGSENPALTYTVSGGTITGTPVLTTTATATSPVGDYDIVVPASDDYTTVNGTLTVTKAPLTIGGGTYSMKQGEALPTLAAVYTGFKNNETNDVLTTQPTIQYEEGVTSASAPGTYEVLVSGAAADNYEITYQKGTLTINEADAVTVTANNLTMVYGDEVPELTYTSEGADLVGTPSLSCSATSSSPVGTYPIVITKGSVTNYNDTYVNGTLTITQKEAALSWSNTAFTYNGTEQKPTATVSNLVGEDACTVTVSGATNAGNHTSTATALSNANYKLPEAKTQAFTIAKAALTITAAAKSKVYGADDPALTYMSSGLVGEDAISGALTRTTGEDVGEYDITQGTLSAGNNYTIAYTGAKLTITQKEAVLSWSNTAFTYNGTEQKPTATVSNLVGEDACTVTVSGATNAGNHTSTATALSNANYKLPEAKTQAFTIAKAPLTISCGEYTMNQGDALPAFEAEFSGFVNGETKTVLITQPVLTTEATSSSALGTYDVIVSGAEAANYEISYQNGSLTIIKVIVDEDGTTIEETEDGYIVTVDEESGTIGEGGVISDEILDANGCVEVKELTYTRELNAPSGDSGDAIIEGLNAYLYTICLPDIPQAAANAKYYTLDAANNTTLTFTEVDNSNLAANTPYLVAVTSGSNLDESKNLTNVTLKREADNSTEKNGFVFKGTLTGLTNAAGAAAGAYILQGSNVWGRVTTTKTNAYIPPFRAYIVPKDSEASMLLSGNIGDDDVTGVQNIRTVDQDGTEHWYDLNGRSISKPIRKGLYIVNGRKEVVK